MILSQYHIFELDTINIYSAWPVVQYIFLYGFDGYSESIEVPLQIIKRLLQYVYRVPECVSSRLNRVPPEASVLSTSHLFSM